jgi:hypothetical protein
MCPSCSEVGRDQSFGVGVEQRIVDQGGHGDQCDEIDFGQRLGLVFLVARER